VVSLQNGNLHLHIPLGSWKQRGGKVLTAAFVYDSPTWTKQTKIEIVNGHKYFITSILADTQSGWRLSTNWGSWEVPSPVSGTVYCAGEGGNTNYYDNWTVSDPEGVLHPVNLSWDECSQSGSTDSPATDGSGIAANIGSNPPVILLKDGTEIKLSKSSDSLYYGSTMEDTNGNLVGSTDTLNRTLVTTTQGSGYTLYTVTDSNGQSQTYRVDYASASITTNFCGSDNNPPYRTCSEWTGNVSYFHLPAKLTLPTGATYQFTWVQGGDGEL
jgi:hypothetical protein